VLQLRHGTTSSNRSGFGGSGSESCGGGDGCPATPGGASSPASRFIPGQLGTNRLPFGRRACHGSSTSGSLSRPIDPTAASLGMGRSAARFAFGGRRKGVHLTLASQGPSWRVGRAFDHARGFGEKAGAKGSPRSVLSAGPTASVAQSGTGHTAPKERSCRPRGMEKKRSQRSWQPP
jgi:hypothetical protein